MTDDRWDDLGPAVGRIWDENAAFWDEYMGDEGNDFHLDLIRPGTERLLDVQPGETVLDVACGNGLFARRLAVLGAEVVACDVSAAMIERARAYPGRGDHPITYHVVDATAPEQLLALGEGRFDAAVCNMALMDMADVDPLLQTLPRLLAPAGRFVFSITHPCFNSVGMRKVVEEEDVDGELVTRYAVKVWRYATPGAEKGLAVVGQPAAQYYFHRSISRLLNKCFAAGFVMDGIEEPTFAPDAKPRRLLSWANFTDIPPALIVRLRLPG